MFAIKTMQTDVYWWIPSAPHSITPSSTMSINPFMGFKKKLGCLLLCWGEWLECWRSRCRLVWAPMLFPLFMQLIYFIFGLTVAKCSNSYVGLLLQPVFQTSALVVSISTVIHSWLCSFGYNPILSSFINERTCNCWQVSAWTEENGKERPVFWYLYCCRCCALHCSWVLMSMLLGVMKGKLECVWQD